MYARTQMIKVLELHRGYDLPEKDRHEGTVPVISSAGYSGSHDQYKCDGENVITGRYGTIGEVFYHEGKCWPLNTALYVSNFKGNYPRYVYYLLKYVLKSATDGKDKSTVPGVDRNVLHQMNIPFCEEIRAQKEMVRILVDIDKKIETNIKINDNLVQQLRLLYDYWFTQFDFPDENGKPYRSSGGQMVWDDVTKKAIPAGWHSAKMSEAIEGIRTGLNPRDNFKLGSGTIKYITVKNLRADGILDFSGCDTIDEPARTIIHRRSDVCPGDILFASIAPLGRCYLVQESPQDWDINESVFSIRCNKATVTPEYFYMHLQGEAFVKKSTACSTGSVFKGIRINTLLDSRMLLPPMQIVEKFSKRTKLLLSLQNKLNKEIQALTELRDWLLPMLMNGQATISD